MPSTDMPYKGTHRTAGYQDRVDRNSRAEDEWATNKASKINSKWNNKSIIETLLGKKLASITLGYNKAKMV